MGDLKTLARDQKRDFVAQEIADMLALDFAVFCKETEGQVYLGNQGYRILRDRIRKVMDQAYAQA